ncbi:hypothetical protein NBRC116584_19710 [Hydrogenophaga sp. 5NK40-0174]
MIIRPKRQPIAPQRIRSKPGRSPRVCRLTLAIGFAVTVVLPGIASAWEIQLQAAPRRVFLSVGNGSFEADSGTVNLVQVDIPMGQVGSGVPLTMSSDSTQSRSPLDNYLTCPDPSSQVLIGASYRRRFGFEPAEATLRVTAPAFLVNGAGDTIPINEISWTVSAPGSGSPGIIPAGTFTPGTQTLTTVRANRYIENCHSFHFANSALRAAGTYTGQVTYTISSP